MNSILITLFIVLVGSFIAIQGTVNSALGEYLGEPIHAALISFGSGFILLCFVSFAFTGGLPSIEKLRSAPNISLIGGILGAIFVTSMIYCVPKIGVANALIASLCGQVLLSLILDHYGALNLPVNPITLPKLLGALFIVLGLCLINHKTFFKAWT